MKIKHELSEKIVNPPKQSSQKKVSGKKLQKPLNNNAYAQALPKDRRNIESDEGIREERKIELNNVVENNENQRAALPNEDCFRNK